MSRILLESDNYYSDRNNKGSFNTNFILYFFLALLSFSIGYYIFDIEIDFIAGVNRDTFDYFVSILLYFFSMLYIPIHYFFKLYLYLGVVFKITYNEESVEINTLFSSTKIRNFEIYEGTYSYAKNMRFLWIKGTVYVKNEEPIFINNGENYTIHDIDRNKYYLITLVNKERDESKS